MSKLTIELDHRHRDVCTNNRGLSFYVLDSVPSDVKYQKIDIAEIARRDYEYRRKLEIVSEELEKNNMNATIVFKPKYKK